MSLKCDVLIIGGGPIGLCCAYYLLKSGRKVTIVDAKEIGKGSGSGNAGHIVPSHIIPLAAPGVVTGALKWMLDPARSPFGMKIGLSPSYLSWLLRFVLACNQDNVSRSVKPLYELGRLSAENFARMIAEERFDCHYSEMGFLNLFKSEDTFHEAQREAEFMQAHGISVRVYDKVAVQDVEPAAREDVIGGVHYTGDAHLDPGLFLAALGKRVREMGAEAHADASVTGFVEAEGKVRAVRTRAGEFEAEQVVLAAGAWTPAVARGLGLDIPIQPGRGYSLTASAVRNMPRHALMLGDRRVAVSPLGDRIRVTGRLEVGTYSTKPDPRWIARLEG
ncbi:FAD-dependent oxidoreductase, partial [Anaerolineae bacterium AMX1]|nr:FAD-dependent oxidoreductase [Anaerolineae bacterium AMX1]